MILNSFSYYSSWFNGQKYLNLIYFGKYKTIWLFSIYWITRNHAKLWCIYVYISLLRNELTRIGREDFGHISIQYFEEHKGDLVLFHTLKMWAIDRVVGEMYFKNVSTKYEILLDLMFFFFHFSLFNNVKVFNIICIEIYLSE